MLPQDAVGGGQRRQGRMRWRGRSLALPAFDRHQGRRYEQLLIFPATLDRETTPAKERTTTDARPKAEVRDG